LKSFLPSGEEKAIRAAGRGLLWKLIGAGEEGVVADVKALFDGCDEVGVRIDVGIGVDVVTEAEEKARVVIFTMRWLLAESRLR